MRRRGGRTKDFMLYRLWPRGTRVEWHDYGRHWRKGTVIAHEDTHGGTTPTVIVELDNALGRGADRFKEVVVWHESELRHLKEVPAC